MKNQNAGSERRKCPTIRNKEIEKIANISTFREIKI